MSETNGTISKLVARQTTNAAVDFYSRFDVLTTDDIETLAHSIEVDDFSIGFIELWFAATCYDGVALDGIAGVKRIGFKKDSGAMTFDTVTDVYSKTSASVMAGALIEIAGTENIEINVTGLAATEVKWKGICKIIYSTTQLSL